MTRAPYAHMLPTIAIVGRPNVGKSTLFNRLTAARRALVSDVPGLTRDRRTGSADMAGNKVSLVDTAGFEEAAPGTIAARMCAQTERAIAEADLVLFLLDAQVGVLPADQRLAQTVRTSGRPIILVANKCEGRAASQGFYEAFQLGLGDPIAISAEHGQGIGDLIGAILAALGLMPHEGRGAMAAGAADRAGEATLPIRIAIVGRPNCGKSTLVNALLGEERMITGPEPGLTRDAVATDCIWAGRPLRLFDTAGLRRKSRISETAERLAVSDTVRAIRFAEVVVLMVDAEHPLEHQDLTIGALAIAEGRALVIAVNKWDLVAEKPKMLRELRSAAEQRLSQAPGVAVIPISALAQRGFDKLMAAVLQSYEIWNRRVPTPELNRWLAEALERHAPPAAQGRRVRIRFMTQPSARPPTFVAFCSRPQAVSHSYLRYLINDLRGAFGLPGVPIRFKLRKVENPYLGR